MWLSIERPADLHEVFLRWLDREDIQDQLGKWVQFHFEGKELSLLDILLYWLRNEPRISLIPSFSILLTGMMTTIDAWHDNDGYHIDGREFVRHAQTGELVQVRHLFPREGEFDDAAREHPLLDPFTFELARAWKPEVS